MPTSAESYAVKLHPPNIHGTISPDLRNGLTPTAPGPLSTGHDRAPFCPSGRTSLPPSPADRPPYLPPPADGPPCLIPPAGRSPCLPYCRRTDLPASLTAGGQTSLSPSPSGQTSLPPSPGSGRVGRRCVSYRPRSALHSRPADSDANRRRSAHTAHTPRGVRGQ